MLPIHLILSGPQEAPYPNGGDEAYWMGQVAGALAAHLHAGGLSLAWGLPQGADGFTLALSSQASPPQREGRQKGPALLWRPGDALGRRAAEAIAFQLAQVYPQPELITLEEAPLESLPGGGGVPAVPGQSPGRGLAGPQRRRRREGFGPGPGLLGWLRPSPACCGAGTS